MLIRQADRAGYAVYAGLGSIEAYIKDARYKKEKAAEELAWLEALRVERMQQIADGRWPGEVVAEHEAKTGRR